MFLKSGLSTDGDTERVLLVGPKAPATYRLRPENKGVAQTVPIHVDKTDLSNAEQNIKKGLSLTN